MDGRPGNISADYVELASVMRANGLMHRRYAIFATKGVSVLLAAAACWVGLAFIGDRWAAIGVAAALGVLSTQVVFFGHDAGPRQLFDGARGNRLVGLVAGHLLTGLSFGWWEPKHGAHHAHPNQIGADPDIAPGAVAFTTAAVAVRRGVGQRALHRQAWTFFPLLTLEAISLRVSGVRSMWARRHDRRVRIEAVLVVAHLALYLGAVLFVLSPLKAVVFIAVQQAAFGVYLGSCFAPNHTGMPALGPGEKVSFAERQIGTARNVTGGRLLTFVLGGLNYQIEHHLFPKMPMANLRRSQPLVRDFCAAHGLTYAEASVIGSYRAVLTHLHRIGRGDDDPVLLVLPGG